VVALAKRFGGRLLGDRVPVGPADGVVESQRAGGAVVRLVLDEGKSVSAAARDLDLTTGRSGSGSKPAAST
jgi:hypothetical protein